MTADLFDPHASDSPSVMEGERLNRGHLAQDLRPVVMFDDLDQAIKHPHGSDHFLISSLYPHGLKTALGRTIGKTRSNF